MGGSESHIRIRGNSPSSGKLDDLIEQDRRRKRSLSPLRRKKHEVEEEKEDDSEIRTEIIGDV